MKKRISVIIPCYNVEKYIDRCVRSLVKQTIGIDSVELIFVDDASTDGTVSRLKRWEKRFPESVLIIECAENGRQGTARNIGLTYASADYIGYVDSDDWVEEEMYECLYRCMEENDVDVVSCRFGRDTGDGTFIHVPVYHGKTGEKITIYTEQERAAFLKNGLPGGVYTKLYKKSFLEKNNLYFPEGLVYEDNYFGFLLAFSVTSLYVTDRVLYHYFYNLESTVTGKNSSHQFDRLKIEQMILEEAEQRGYLEKYREYFLGVFLSRYYLNTLHLIFTRFDELPLDILEEMKKTVLKKFPEWKSSEKYQKMSDIEKGFLQTLEIPMTEERWKNLKENYLFLVQKKDVEHGCES